jgi:hypothetical protein
MAKSLRMLMLTAAAGPLIVSIFAGAPAYAQCNDRPGQSLAQVDPDQRDPHNDRLSTLATNPNRRDPLADPDRRDPHSDRFAQTIGDDRRDPHNDRVAQVNPDQRDPHNDRLAQANPDQRDPHNDRVAQNCK